ncbi:DUF2975 domain-containing protein [Planococcus salinus]|uniref:DUF2975 domain-containing protein n=1 Tax=Planococcus salinus TaxID=1848460 RepID=A0A3M8P320_9BACL|nr:DUF2975 domain-containing protein [Planococcus salinus]RNF38127.1 DUF2975 domain-containing protein [Planococcus salinus]
MKRKQASTLFLKMVLVLIGIAVLSLCIFGLPGMAARDAELHPETAYLQYPFLLSAYIFFVPFFIALYQTFKLLIYIDRNKAFSGLSVRALNAIKYCAVTIIVFIVVGEVFTIALIDGDITHIIMLGLIGTFASSVIAIFAGLLQKLLKDAIAIKSENDLIV